MGMSEREHHIKILEQFLHDYQEWGEDLELEKTIKYAISSLKTDEAYQLMYEGVEVYTKADMVAMLEELDLQIEEMNTSHLSNDALAGFRWGRYCIRENIQQKINALKGK